MPITIKIKDKNKNTFVNKFRTPLYFEKDYYIILRKIVESIVKQFKSEVLSSLDRKFITNQFQDESYNERFNSSYTAFQKKVLKKYDKKRLRKIAEKMVTRLNIYNVNIWARGFGEVGIDTSKTADFKNSRSFLATKTNSQIDLMQGVTQDSLDRMKGVILRGFESGKSIADMTKDIVNQTKISKKRAYNMAVKETLSLNSQLTKKRAQNYGLNKAVWNSMGDNRVRPEHRKFNGQEYEIGVGLYNPTTKEYEEAGSAFRCRCFPDFILEDLSDD